MNGGIRLQVVFFMTHSHREPVREWLMSLDKEDRKTIGEDIKSLQFGWPLGMPLVRKMGTDLWEIRSQLPNRIARVIFTVQDDNMVLLHGFIKKSQKTLKAELNLAKRRLTQFKEHEQ